MSLTAFAVLLRILSNPLANVFQKRLTLRGNDPLVVNFLTFFILSLFCIVPATRIDWTAFPAAFWSYGVVAGVFGATGNAFLVRALQGGDLSVLGPINSYKSVVGLLTGMLLLGEMPNGWGVAGIVLIVAGSYFVLDTPEERFSAALFRRRDIRYRIWAMMLTAVEAVLIKKVILYSSPAVSFYMWCGFGALFSLALLPLSGVRTGRERGRADWRDVPMYAALVFCIGIMQYTTNFVFDRMDVGYALALFQLSTIVSIGLGYRVFRERHILRKLWGAVVMIAGSTLIILLKG